MSTTEDHNEGLTVYEVGYLILPSISEDKLSEVVDSMKEIIVKHGGRELDSEAPFKQNLAYTMTKVVGASRYVVNDAYLGWLKFEAEAGDAHLIKQALEKVDSLLRFLLIKAPRKTAFTFAMAQAKLDEAEALEAEAAAALLLDDEVDEEALEGDKEKSE